MDMTIRAMTPEERNYCYSQSQQISMQTGLIGHLRGDMGSNGKGFFSTFFDFRADLKTEDFKGAFDNVINALRFDENYGGVLKDRSALAAYCRRTPESSFGGDGREYGFRVDTEQYSYMLRLNPNRGEYNLYCYCYVRQWLDRHLHHAEKGIRFITPDYKEKFRIDDLDYEDWKDDLEADYPDLSEQERIALMYEINGDYLDDERMNLNLQLSAPILVIGDLGLWNGRRMGYKEIASGNIRDCLYSDTDYSTWYVDRLGDLRCDAIHHDGTNHYLYRTYKPGVRQSQIDNLKEKLYFGTATRSDITRITRRLGDEIAKVYGFSIPRQRQAQAAER